MTEVVSSKSDVDIKASFIGAEELKIAASLLYLAYRNDPIFLDIFNSEKDDYEQRLRAAIREELNAFWQAKQPIVALYRGDVMVGVACLNSPDESITSERFWHWRLKMMLGAGYLSTKQMIQKEETILKAVPMKNFHMLSLIAVHPLHQHSGFGHYMVATINTVLEEHPNSEGIAVYATTSQFKEFFQNVGYTFIEEVTVGKVSGSLMVHYRDNK